MNLCLELVADECFFILGFFLAVLWNVKPVLAVLAVVFELLVYCTTMSQLVNLHVLDLMEAYHCNS